MRLRWGRRLVKKLFSVLLFAFGMLTLAHAQNWPDKPVTVIVPFSAGGATDTLARALSGCMQETTGQPFVVVNKPGATGTTGAAQAKRAPPDGYTLMVAALAPFVIAPHLMKSVSYDAGRDFDPLTVA